MYELATPEVQRAKTARRRAQKLCATPAWANQDHILFFYEIAKLLSERTGVPRHVDHIVPLRHRKVCGLHCAENLQVLPATTNLIKGNRSWPNQ
jgi:hypothetical protein